MSVINPQTGRTIKVGGSTYQRLVEQGILRANVTALTLPLLSKTRRSLTGSETSQNSKTKKVTRTRSALDSNHNDEGANNELFPLGAQLQTVSQRHRLIQLSKYLDLKIAQLNSQSNLMDQNDLLLKLYRMKKQMWCIVHKQPTWDQATIAENDALQQQFTRTQKGISDLSFDMSNEGQQMEAMQQRILQLLHQQFAMLRRTLVMQSAVHYGWYIYFTRNDSTDSNQRGNVGDVLNCTRLEHIGVPNSAPVISSAKDSKFVIKINRGFSGYQFDNEVQIMKTLTRHSPQLTAQYIADWSTPVCDCVVMQKVGRWTAYDFIDSYSWSDKHLKQLLRCYDDIIQMFVDTYIDHGDFHYRNVLVDLDNHNDLRAYVIDFDTAVELPHTLESQQLIAATLARSKIELQTLANSKANSYAVASRNVLSNQ